MKLQEARRDHYRRLARRSGLKSRAYFKLEQLDRRFQLLQPGFTVVDFGCAPGGWLQYASGLVGPRGFVLGVDLKSVDIALPNVRTVVGDVSSAALANRVVQELGREADVILADLAPSVSGIWELDQRRQIDLTRCVVSLMPALLRDGGSSVLKVFQGEDTESFVRGMKEFFAGVTVVRPPATRSRSSEIYLVCRGFRKLRPAEGSSE